MHVIESGQVFDSQFLEEDLTVVLCADGYEERSVAAASQLKGKDISFRYAIPFKEQKILSRPDNDIFFQANEYELLPELSGSDFDGACSAFEKILTSCIKRGSCRIAIDYSCMTRAWLGAFINHLFDRSSEGARVDVFFLYSPAAFSEPRYPSPNAIVTPLRGFCSLRAVDEPVALVIGCGYEKMRATGLKEYIDPATTVLFYTDPAFDNRYPQLVIENNAGLFAEVGEKNVVRYPLQDMDSTAAMLYDRVTDLSKNFRVILAPLGVKPFSLLSMLLAARYRLADVWRVSGETLTTPRKGESSGELLVYRVSFDDNQ